MIGGENYLTVANGQYERRDQFLRRARAVYKRLILQASSA
jgi:hypothetical protein